MLVIKRSAGITQEVNQRNPLHADKETCKEEISPTYDLLNFVPIF